MTALPSTDRQLEALACYLRHGTVKEAADALGVAPQTMKNHLAAVYADLDVGSAHEAAMALGWLRIPERYEACGWIGMCTRPRDHRGHHGGWTGIGKGDRS